MLLLLFATQAGARRSYTYYFDSTLALSHPANFSEVRVVDARADTAGFGIINGSLSSLVITTATPLSQSLRHFGLQLIRNHAPAQNSTLLVVLRHLSVAPQTSDAVNTVYADADFYTGTEGSYRYLFTADSFYESRCIAGKDVWESQLEQIWFRYFDKASGAVPDKADSPSYYTVQAALSHRADLLKAFPAYNASVYPEGVYLTRESFLMLRPDFPRFKQWTNRDNIAHPYTFFRTTDKGKHGSRLEDSTFYAVYDGHHWYKSGGNSTYTISFEEGDFYFKGSLEGLRGHTSQQGTFIAAGIAGGLVGVILVSAAGGLTHALNNAQDKKLFKKDPTTLNLYRIRLDVLHNRYVPVARYVIL